MYVHDLITAGVNLKELITKKEQSVELLKKEGFSLDKRNSTLAALESENSKTEYQLTCAKQILTQSSSNAEILDLEWSKETGKLLVGTLETRQNRPTRRNILSELASVYDPIGLVSPVLLN